MIHISDKGGSIMPKDPIILLSYINTKLRDEYPSLSELAAAEGVSVSEIESILAAIGYKYDSENNRFI